MGKTGENERIKLRATFNNNIAVGLYLGGFLIPYLAVFQKAPQVADFIVSSVQTRKIIIDRNDFGYVFAVTVAFVLAIYLAQKRRRLADDLLRKLAD